MLSGYGDRDGRRFMFPGQSTVIDKDIITAGAGSAVEFALELLSEIKIRAFQKRLPEIFL
jgi:hypothetical protein